MSEGPLAIVGYMGSGKSTVGRAAAHELGWGFLDLDEAIANAAGLSIPEIFESFGEPHFRELEHRALLDALDGRPRLVVACGGGVVVDPRNRARLAQTPTVFLKEDTDTMFRRTRGPGRPLRGTSYEDFARRYADRLPHYLGVSGLHVEPGERPPRRVADEIVSWLRKA